MRNENSRNTIIFVVCAAVIFIAYQFFVLEPNAKRRMAEQKSRQAATQASSGTRTGPLGPNASAPAVQMTRAQAAASSPRIPVATPALQGSISLKGGRIDDLYLTQYRETLAKTSPPVELLRPEGAPNAYFADFGWTGQNLPAMPNGQTVWRQTSTGALAPNSPVTLAYDNGQGLNFTRKIAVDDKFLFTITDTVANTGAGAVTIAPYASVQRQGLPEAALKNASGAHEGAVGALGDKHELRLQKFKDWKKKGDQTFESVGGWIGVTDKYWLAAIIPAQGEAVKAQSRVTPAANLDIYDVNILGAARTLAPGQTATETTRLFAGAKSVPVLKDYEKTLGVPRFEDAVDWGKLWFITKPVFFILDWFYKLVGNFGVAILMLTVLVKVLFFYPTNLSYASMTKMKKVTPQVEALKAKFKDDPAKQQQEMLALYQREKINPLSGCLPILATIPVFLALFKVLNVSIEMRHAPFFGFAQDLSARDPSTIWNLFGMIPYDPALLPVIGGLMGGPLHIGVWAIAYGVTMWLTQSMNPPAPDPAQQKIFALMPLIFTFALSQLAVGLLIYYSWSNLLTIVQQYIMMRRYKVDNPIDKAIAKLTGKPAAAG